MSFALPARRSSAEALLSALDHSFAIVEFAMDGTVLDANETFQSMAEYSATEIRGMPHRTLAAGSEGPIDADGPLWTALERGERRTGDFRMLGGSGQTLWIRGTYTPIIDRRGRPARVVLIGMDVTAERLRSAEAEAQAAAVRRTMAVAQFGLDGTVLDANDAFLDALGYRLDEVQGQQHWNFVTPCRAQSAAYEEFWTALRNGRHQAADHPLLGKGGREVWLDGSYSPVTDGSGRSLKIVMQAVDLTAAKRIALDLGGQIAALDRLQGIVHFDLSGEILDANANFLDAMGYRLEEVKGQHHFMFVEDAYAITDGYKDFWERLRAGEHFAAVYQLVGKGGREVWFKASYDPILDAHGRPYKVVLHATDVTACMTIRSRAIDTAEQALGNIWTASAVAEEVIAAIEGIGETIERSKIAVDGIHRQAQAADRAKGQLRESTHAMDDVIQLIARISQQINLLALNATIEAARAGEAGRGFAVVATEVKNLASQAHSATVRISEQIAAMQAASDEVIGSLGSVGQAIGEVRGLVSEAAGAIAGQGAMTRSVADRMQDAADKVASINRSLDDWIVGLEERRRNPRIRTFRKARIVVDGRADAVPCILRDISATGARIEISDDVDLPERFRFAISGERGDRICSIVRRSNDTVSVRFIQAEAPHGGPHDRSLALAGT